ncbi:MAG: HD domain-containing protein [Desulfobulbaceae bacterium]|nr:HD domain-containing protein [Desulfobulbaceae bacterium]
MEMTQTPADDILCQLRDRLDRQEEVRLSPLAVCSGTALRRRPETLVGHRQNFFLDGDRILHSRAYSRYIDKTQVFYMVANDHITHRVLHVQLVAKIARSAGRFLGLNEDLIEAIALGHDIGHPPFGHDGEKILSALCTEHGLPPFHHNIQSVLFLDRLERGGWGWNLTLQTLDGILFHDGETHSDTLSPSRGHDFALLDRVVEQLPGAVSQAAATPMTLEGCLVRLCDTIAYIGRDIEDAIELKLIGRDELPATAVAILGNTNGSIVYRLVADLIANGCADDRLGFSQPVGEALGLLKQSNYERIYLNPLIKRSLGEIRTCYRALFESYLEALLAGRGRAMSFPEAGERAPGAPPDKRPPAAQVRDFIAGMTDDYFLAQAALLGCRIPAKITGPLGVS